MPYDSTTPMSTNAVSFARVGSLLDRMLQSLSDMQRTELQAEVDLVQGFLSQFPPDFCSPVPYPGGQPGELVYAVLAPPKRWP